MAVRFAFFEPGFFFAVFFVALVAVFFRVGFLDFFFAVFLPACFAGVLVLAFFREILPCGSSEAPASMSMPNTPERSPAASRLDFPLVVAADTAASASASISSS